jgi:predicted Zn finger-like uncharacterized protein
MKFLCPQCKAKYRIADEKLSQRASSKMKCRKCGHVIDIHSATVPDDSIAPPPPEPVPAAAPAEKEKPKEKEAAKEKDPPARKVPKVAPAGPATARRPMTGATTTSAIKRPAPVVPAAKRAPAAAPPPRRGRGAAVAEVVPEPASPTPPDAPEAPPPVEDRRSAPQQPKREPEFRKAPDDEPTQRRNDFDDDGPTRIHDGGALTAAFSAAVGEKIASEQSPQVPPDEWYVGIDGSPVGPLPIAELKKKAAERKITLESLAWKDGLEDWKPIRDFPELVSIVEEAREAFFPDPKTVPAPSPLEQAAVSAKTSDKSESNADVLAALGVSRRKQGGVSHPVAWASLVVAVAFGVTIGIVLFSKTEKQEVVKYVEVPASASAAQQAVNDPTQVLEEAQVSAGSSKHGGSGTAKPETSAPAKPASGSGLLTGLNGIAGLGPSTGATDVASGTAPGGQLDGASIQRVVANFSSSVRRGCWDQAIAARAPDAPSSARVGVTITILPSGSVDNVTTTGDPKGYPNLAHCIESRVRAWRFPRSSGTTTAQVPFVFASQ